MGPPFTDVDSASHLLEQQLPSCLYIIEDVVQDNNSATASRVALQLLLRATCWSPN